MSIASSQSSKKYPFVDLLFAFFASTLVLLVLVPSNGNMYNSIRTAPGILDSIRATIPISGDVSFTADQRYWNANCSQEWSSDAWCDTIVARTQTCSRSAASGYCSEYKSYLQEYLNK